jgi:hypothetical protein
LLQTLDSVSKEILRTLDSGCKLTRLASRLGRSPSTLHYSKRRLAGIIREHLSEDILRQNQEWPSWLNNIVAERQRLLCQLERRDA